MTLLFGRAGLWLHRAGARVVVLAVLVIFGIASAALAQDFRFSRISVDGNLRIEDATILAYADIEPGTALSAAEVNAAGQRLRESGLFQSVEILPQGGTLLIRVVELPTINRIAIEGNKRIKDETLLPLINSESRRVFSAEQAQADADAIASAYGAAGRISAFVVPRIIERSDNRVDLVFEVTESSVVEVERIAFVGNRTYSDYRLRRILQTKQAGFLRQIFQNDTFVEDRIAFDQQLLTDFYRARGYVDFEVTAVTSQLTRKRDAFLITFNIREGLQYRFGNITASSELAEVDVQAFRDAIRLREGGVYSPVLVDNTVTRLENLAVREALNFVRVEPRVTRNDRDRTLDIDFALVRGPRVFVERIDIEGNATTLDRVVRRQFRVVEGDPFNPREIALAASRIRALGYFSEVNVTPRQGTTDDRVMIDVDVVEQPTGSLSFGASYSGDAGAGFTVSFSERNFIGRGQTVSLAMTSDQDRTDFSASFTEPYLLGRDVMFSTRLNVGASDDADATFDTETTSLSGSLGFSTGDFSRLNLSYTLSEDSILNVDDAGSSFILQQEEGTEVTSSLGYSYRYDTRGRGLDPSRGVLLRVGQDVGGFGGSNQFVKTSFLAQGQMGIFNEEVTLSATLEAGNISTIDGNSRVTDRYFGRSRVVRGFAPNGFGPRDLVAPNEDALGGNNFGSLKLEAQFPLGLPEELGLGGAVFYDIGSVWGLDNTAGGLDGLSEVDDDMYLRSAFGVSLLWETAIGPLRFNFSEVLEREDYDLPQSFEFTVSTRF